MKRIISLALYILIALFGAAAQGGAPASPLSVSVGLSPTSLGTIGESFSIGYKLLPFISIFADGIQQRLVDTDIEFERYGGPAKGDISRDLLSGEAGIRAPLSLGAFALEPYLAIAARQTGGYTVGRLMADSDDGFPRDTFSFFDTKSSELIVAGSGGATVALALPSIRLSGSAYYVPLARSRLRETRFMCEPEVPVGENYAAYYWDERASDSLFDCGGYGASVDLSWTPRAFGLGIDAGGSYRAFSYAGDSDSVRNVWYGWKEGGVASIKHMIVDQSIDSTAAVDEGALEIGLRFRFIFLRNLLKLRGEPVAGVAYVRTVVQREYDYGAGSPVAAEKWTETMEYTKFTLGWGM